MSTEITEGLFENWVEHTGISTTISTQSTISFIHLEGYEELASKLVQKLILKAKNELLKLDQPFPPKELIFQIDCKLELQDENTGLITLGCCPGSNCAPCFATAVSIA